MSGGQRQAVAVSRAAAFASKVVILDEPTAALGVRESRRVLDLILRLRGENRAVIVVSTRWTTSWKLPTVRSCFGVDARLES